MSVDQSLAQGSQPDLQLTLAPSPVPVTVGELLAYRMTMTNPGNAAANNVGLIATLSSNVTFFSAELSQGNCTHNAGTVSCALGTVAVGAAAAVRIIVTPGVVGAITLSASVSQTETDSNPANNSAVQMMEVVPRTFYSGPNLSVGRAYHTATRLLNGRVLIAGGITSTGQTASAELYDPQTKGFSPTGSMKDRRADHEATLLTDGTVLITGGAQNNFFGAELYNPVTGTFTSVSNMGSIHAGHTATLLPDGRVLVAGDAYDLAIAAAEIYVPALRRFTNAASMTSGASWGEAVLLNDGNVFLAGGRDGWGDGAVCDLYNTGAGTMTPVSRLRYMRIFFGATPLPDGRVLLIGGTGWKAAEFFDPVTRAIVAGNSTRAVHYLAHATRLPNGQVLVTGSDTQPELFDPATGTFSRVVEMAAARQFHTATLLTDGRVLIVGGMENGTNLASSEIYDPARTKSPPAVSIGDASGVEVDAGTAHLVFNLSLSSAMGWPVTVAFATSSGSAVAGEDFVETNGTVSFPPGTTNLTLAVSVIGDLNHELDETFTVSLSSPSNAVLDVAIATGTILNADPVPTVSVAPATIREPNVRTTNMVFTAFLSAASHQEGSVGYATLGGTAVAGSDYLPTNGVLVFSPGVTSQTFSVTVKGDTLVEAAETFSVILNSATNLIAGPAGVGTIVSDDGLPGVLDHFEFTPITSPQNAFLPMNVTVTAKDAANNTVTNFTRRVALSGSSSFAPSYKFDFEETDFSLWSPLNAGPNPGPYIFKVLDLNGDGLVSTAFGLVPNPGTPDGIRRNVWVRAGINYFISVDIARANEGSVGYGPDTRIRLSFNGYGYSEYSFPTSIFPGQLQRTNLIAYVGGQLTDGFYPVEIVMDRGFGENADIKAYVDDVKIAHPRLTPDWTADFTNGVWSGGVVAHEPVTNYVMRVEDGDGHTGTSSPLDIVQPPTFYLSDASAVEASALNPGMMFNVRLSGPSALAITLDYFTRDVDALSGRDYIGTNGTLTIPPGATNGIIRVVLIEDDLDEPNRSFLLMLTNWVNAIPWVSTPMVSGRIIDDDPPPTISIADAAVREGDSGTTNAVFPVTLSKMPAVNVIVSYSTTPGTANSTNDYTPRFGSLTFPPGTTNLTIEVPVKGNTVNEPDETFTVTLGGPINATLARAVATGTILNDDAVPARLNHFAFDPIPTAQYAGGRIQVSVKALDYLGNPVTGFAGSAMVIGRTDQYYSEQLFDDFERGNLVGWTNYNSPQLVVSNVANTAAAGLRSVRLSGRAPSPSYFNGLQRRITNSRPTGISFHVRAAQTNAQCGRLNAMGGAGYRAVDFSMNRDGRMGLVAEQAFAGVPYESDRWYRVDVELDWTQRRANCRIDGALVITNVAFPDDPYSGTDSIVLQNTDTGTSWFDEIRVFTLGSSNLLVTPPNLTSFSDGVWTGLVAIRQAATNVYLMADDGAEHIGQSGLFNVQPPRLTVRHEPPGLVIDWLPAEAILEEASGVRGPWNPLAPVRPPLQMQAVGTTRFFRVRVP